MPHQDKLENNLSVNAKEESMRQNLYRFGLRGLLIYVASIAVMIAVSKYSLLYASNTTLCLLNAIFFLICATGALVWTFKRSYFTYPFISLTLIAIIHQTIALSYLSEQFDSEIFPTIALLDSTWNQTRTLVTSADGFQSDPPIYEPAWEVYSHAGVTLTSLWLGIIAFTLCGFVQKEMRSEC
jgi:hypothetical protein